MDFTQILLSVFALLGIALGLSFDFETRDINLNYLLGIISIGMLGLIFIGVFELWLIIIPVFLLGILFIKGGNDNE